MPAGTLNSCLSDCWC